MSAVRSYLLLLLVLTLLIGQAYAVSTKSEHWPLSNYPMYADTQGKTVSALQADGFQRDGTRYAISTRTELTPFDPSRILGFIRRLGRGSAGRARRTEAARELLALYELQRVRGNHHGPELTGLELYETTWRIVPFATNRDHPERRRLIASTRSTPTDDTRATPGDTRTTTEDE